MCRVQKGVYIFKVHTICKSMGKMLKYVQIAEVRASEKWEKIAIICIEKARAKY